MKKVIQIALAAALIVSGAAPWAHHSFQATFQEGKKIQVEGTVTEFSFSNPHILVYLEVANDDGSKTQWMSEGAAATLMRRAGWSRDTLQPGELIRVHGDATHDGSPMVSIDSIDVLDPEGGAVVRTLSRNNGEAAPEAVAGPMPLRLEDGRPNLTGAWTNHGMAGGRPRAPELDLNDMGLAAQASYDRANDPQIFCDPPGLVRQAGVTPHPIRITQLADRVIIEYEEFGGRREVFFDASQGAKGIKTHLGDSVARYEDEALIIETINLLGNPSSPEGNYLSHQTTTVETYQRADSDEYGPTISIEMVATDPLYLNQPTVLTRLKKSAGAEYEFIENNCQQPLRQREVVNPAMSFFLTSRGPGDGANMGGLEGADAHCAALAETVGAGERDWRAYLSATGDAGVNARDRIGNGPWYNARGVPAAIDVDNLHSENNNLTRTTALDERGQRLNGRGDDPNRHDILTGSQLDGTALNSGSDTTCSNWTSNGEGSALVGHFDREGGGANPTSWNSAHPSRGCSQAALRGTGGDGLFYCFAAD